MSRSLEIGCLSIIPLILVLTVSAATRERAGQPENLAKVTNRLTTSFEQNAVFGSDYFIQNRGQWKNPDVHFSKQAQGATVSVTQNGLALQFVPAESFAPETINIAFPNSSPTGLSGTRILPLTFNYYRDAPEYWLSGVPAYRGVLYTRLYPGVDLEVTAETNELKMLFSVAPGADWRRIRLEYSGGTVELDESGNLWIKSAGGEVIDKRPVFYQEINGERRTIAGSFLQVGAGIFSFEAQGAIDPELPLEIDPELVWSSYFGGSNEDGARDIAVDSAGNVYVTGFTNSSDMTTTNAFDTTLSGQDVFVAKYNANHELTWATFLGGSGDEIGLGLALDEATTSILVTGKTDSNDFPATPGALEENAQGGQDGFLVRIADNGSTITWATYLGGMCDDWINDLALDTTGDIYLTGYTESSDFPTSTTESPTYGGTGDVFVTKALADGTTVSWSTYLGASGIREEGFSIAVNDAHAAVCGDKSNAILVAQYNLSGELDWQSTIDGSSDDNARAITLSADGDLFIAGDSNSTNLPQAINANQGGYDLVAARVDTNGNTIWTRYWGDENNDGGLDIYHTTGTLLLTGFLDYGAPQDREVFLLQLDVDGAERDSTVEGGDEQEEAYGVDFISSGTAYIAGQTGSDDLYIAGGGAVYNASSDTFVMAVSTVEVYPQIPPTWDMTDALLAQWTLNDNAANTTVLDETGNYDGTFNDATGDPNTNAHDITGLINGALEFDGSDDHVNLGTTLLNSSALLGVNGAFSLMLWFRLDTTLPDDYMYLVNARSSASDLKGFSAWYENRTGNPGVDTLYARIDIGPSDTLIQSGTFSDTNWHQLIVTRNGQDWDVYFDGANIGGVNDANYNIDFTHTTPLYFAQNWAGAQRFDGDLDDVRFFDRALTTTEIAGLYNGGSGTEYNFNSPPYFLSELIIKPNATEDAAYAGTLTNVAFDNDGDPLTFSKVSGPAWLSVSSTGALSGTPDNDDVSVATFTVRVEDPLGESAQTTLQITVENTNDAPAFVADTLTKKQATTGPNYVSTLVRDVLEVDVEDTLTFSKVSGPDWLTVSSSGELTGAPDLDDLGLNTWTVKVQDVAGASDTATLNITVVKPGENWNVSSALTAWWKLNDNAANSTVLNSVSIHHGTFSDASGNANTSAHSIAGLDNLNTAFNFDGVDDYVDLTDDILSSTSLFNTNGKFSIACWFQLGGSMPNDYLYLVSGRTSASGLKGFSAWYENRTGHADEDTLNVRVDYGAADTLIKSAAFDDDYWHQVVITRDGQKWDIYLDGWNIGGGDNASYNIDYTHTTPLYLAQNWVSAQRFEGGMDDVRVFNRALTPAEILGLYNDGNGTEDNRDNPSTIFDVTGNLLAHWTMNDNAANTTVADSWGPHDGTMNDATGNPNTSAHTTTGATNQEAALSLDGTDDYINLGTDIFSSSTLFGVNGKISVVTWFKLDSSLPNNYLYLVSGRTSASGLKGFSAWYENRTGHADEDTLNVRFDYGAADTLVKSGAFNNTNWHQLIVTRNGQDWDAYLDNVSIGGVDNASYNVDYTHTTPFYLGQNWVSAQRFDGAFDDTRVFNKVLSSTERAGLYNNGNGFPRNLNYPPFFLDDPIVLEATEDVAFNGSIASAADDFDAGDSLTFSKTSGPSWLSVAANGALSGTPGNSDVGLNKFVAKVTDVFGAYDLTNLHVAVENVNDTPTFTVKPVIKDPAVIEEPYSGSLAGDVTEIDAGDSLTFTKVTGPSWLNVASNGALSGTPTMADYGETTWTVRVTDLASASDETSLGITVNSRVPTILGGPDQAIILADELFLVGYADDDGYPDPPGELTLEWSKISGPGTVTFFDENVNVTTATFSTTGTYVLNLNGDDGQFSVDDTITIEVFDTPVLTTTSLDLTIATTIDNAVEFIYSGGNPVQMDVDPDDLITTRVSLIRGTVFDQTGAPLPGVFVSISGHPEYGRTISRDDGQYDLAVNGGGYCTAHYEKSGHQSAQRKVFVEWNDYVIMDDVYLKRVSNDSTAVDLTASNWQVVQGTVEVDVAGTRTAVLLIPPDLTTATLSTNGQVVAELTQLHVRIQENTVGENGQELMPANLPPTSAYTYCVNFTSDETRSYGADRTQFNIPAISYVDNFRNFPVGCIMPFGYYDEQRNAWIPEKDGLIIKILSETDGKADLDIDGDELADTGGELTARGITDGEREQLALLYAPGQELWRVPIPHFTPCDFNAYWMNLIYFPFPRISFGDALRMILDKLASLLNGGIIDVENQIYGEELPISGTPFSLVYTSDRLQNFKKHYQLHIPLYGESGLHPLLIGVKVVVKVAGRKIEYNWNPDIDTFPATIDDYEFWAEDMSEWRESVPETFLFEWDGKDAFGRVVQGRKTVKVEVGYVFLPFYAIRLAQMVTNSNSSSFGSVPQKNTPALWRYAGATRPAYRWSKFTTYLGTYSALHQGYGGWTLDANHVYAPHVRTNIHGGNVYRGDGTSQFGRAWGFADESSRVIDKLVSSSNDFIGVTLGPDGSLYYTQQDRIRKRTPNGSISTVAGALWDPGCTFVDSTAAAVRFDYPGDIALGPDGSLYVCDVYNFNVKRIFPDANGTISGSSLAVTFAGVENTDGIPGGQCGENFRPQNHGHPMDDEHNYIPANQAVLNYPRSIEVAPDGTVYILEYHGPLISGLDPTTYKSVIRSVDPNGIIHTVAVSNPAGGEIWTDIALAPDGSLFIGSMGIATGGTPPGFNGWILHLDLDGELTVFAGGGSPADGIGDGLLATDASIYNVVKLDVDPLGNVYFYEGNLNKFSWTESNLGPRRRIRRIGIDGLVRTIAGVHEDQGEVDDVIGDGGDGGPAEDATMGYVQGFDIGHDGVLYFTQNWNTHGVRYIKTAEPPTDGSTYFLPSEDGGAVYVFDKNGRQLRTVDFLTGQDLLTFTYNEAHLLTKVTDLYGRETVITRDGQTGRATKFTAPFGQETTLEYDANGYLNKITDPAGREYQAEYDADGLLEKFIYPTGAEFTSAYNADGQLIAHADQEGGAREFTRTEKGTNWNVAVTTALERTTTYSVAWIYDDGSYYVQGMEHQQRVITTPGDMATTITRTANGRTYTETPDGARYFDHEQTHKFWGALVAVPNVAEIDTPGGISRRTSYGYDLALRDADDPLGGLQSGESIVDTNQNGFIPDWTTTTDYSNNSTPSDETDDTYSVTFETPEGRLSHATLDYLGRTIESWVEGFNKTTYEYDSVGRLIQVTQEGDTAAEDRVTSYIYYTAIGEIHNGYLRSVIDPSGLETIYEYDDSGNATTQTLTNGNQLAYVYDVDGKLISLATASGQIHEIQYNNVWQPMGYAQPKLNGQDQSTTTTYNAERQLTSVEHADGTSFTFSYDTSSGLWNEFGTIEGNFVFEYDSAERLTSLTAPLERGVMTFEYDGSLVKEITLTENDASTGALEWTYDSNSILISSLAIKGLTLEYTYDNDYILTDIDYSTSTFHVERPLPPGSITTATLGLTDTIYERDSMADLASDISTFDGAVRYGKSYTIDKLQQITRMDENWWDDTDSEYVESSRTFAYDNLGQLISVCKNNNTTQTFVYDQEGNRIRRTETGESDTYYTYNEHNQLTASGDGTSTTTYTYSGRGALLTKTTPDDNITTYSYDSMGGLLSVLAKDDQGTTVTDIEYVLDPRNRRVGRKDNGVYTNRWLYGPKETLIAELESSGTVKTLFVYATRHVPEYMIRVDQGNAIYRILTDQTGSPRMVINVQSGAVAQEMDYDVWGKVTRDTNPGFQPFGFAGGLYDAGTGLVRFGFRDYDPETGRWTAKDPAGFLGGLNLYAYLQNDPVNLVDPLGLGPDYAWALWTAVHDGGITLGEGVADSLIDLWNGINSMAPLLSTLTNFGLNPLIINNYPDWSDYKIDPTDESLAWSRFGGYISGAAGVNALGAKGGPKGGGPKCFVAGTLVLVRGEDGSVAVKLIEEIQVGDIVGSYNHETGKFEWGLVVSLFRRVADSVADLTIADEAGNLSTITGTPEHPFFVPAAKDYLPISELEVGEVLKTLDDSLALVQKVEIRQGEFTVYNFEVEGTHNYYVASALGGALVNVHNSCKGPGKTPRKPSSQIRKEWEEATGQKWPKDPKTGHNHDVTHTKPLADGGTNDLSNIVPKPHDAHMQDHINAGDFIRWGGRRNR